VRRSIAVEELLDGNTPAHVISREHLIQNSSPWDGFRILPTPKNFAKLLLKVNLLKELANEDRDEQ